MGEKYNVPRGIPYAKFTPAQKAELERALSNECKYLGRQLCHRTRGVIDKEDAKSDLICHGLKIIARVKNGELHRNNLVAYLRKCLEGRLEELFENWVDSRALELDACAAVNNLHDSEDAGELDIGARNRAIEDACRRAMPFTSLIKRTARLLRIPVNDEDWVDTAVKVIFAKRRKSRRILTPADNKSIDDLHEAFIRSGYVKPDQTRAPTFPDFLEACLRENPTASQAEIQRKMDEVGRIDKSLNQALPSVRKRLFGGRGAGKAHYQSQSGIVRELWESGVRDYWEIVKHFQTNNIPYKPSVLYRYLGRLKRYGRTT